MTDEETSMTMTSLTYRPGTRMHAFYRRLIDREGFTAADAERVCDVIEGFPEDAPEATTVDQVPETIREVIVEDAREWIRNDYADYLAENGWMDTDEADIARTALAAADKLADSLANSNRITGAQMRALVDLRAALGACDTDWLE